jgi:nucleoside phosphorylase
MLDEEFDGPKINKDDDDNVYVFGRIAKHYVVIGCSPPKIRFSDDLDDLEPPSAARTARDMVRTFPHLRFALMVGIGGGAPGTLNDIRLGDVAVSQPNNGFGGLIQLDMGKLLESQPFQKRADLGAPPETLLDVISEMQRLYSAVRKTDGLAEHLQRLDDREDFRKPAVDRLYATNSLHVGGKDCDKCDSNSLVIRPERQNNSKFLVHYGNIASSNQVLKDASYREKVANDPELRIICFEMAAAGLMSNFPCLIIRGICDYPTGRKGGTSMLRSLLLLIHDSYSWF